ncbi:MAG: UbiA-like polyprenyltransferase [Anaerolineales bacterium]|jgi:4-hydroxybenzoate polyprenyltransferase
MLRQARTFLEMIKFEHTVFALPFAYVGMVLAAKGWPSVYQALWITVAMVAARTFGMGGNRLIDLQFDRINPRTKNWPLSTGLLRPWVAWLALGVSAAVLGVAAWRLGSLPLRLLPAAYAILIGYSFTKRFTWLSHFAMGFVDGLAPLGAWVGERNSLFTARDLPAWILLLTVTLWMGGVDAIYGCADYVFDQQQGLHSLAARYGIPVALRVSDFSHALAVALLLVLGVWASLGWIYWLGLLAVIALLFYEHSLIRPSDLSRINLAFFNVNGYISLTLLVAVLAVYLVH